MVNKAIALFYSPLHTTQRIQHRLPLPRRLHHRAPGLRQWYRCFQTQNLQYLYPSSIFLPQGYSPNLDLIFNSSEEDIPYKAVSTLITVPGFLILKKTRQIHDGLVSRRPLTPTPWPSHIKINPPESKPDGHNPRSAGWQLVVSLYPQIRSSTNINPARWLVHKPTYWSVSDLHKPQEGTLGHFTSRDGI